MTLQEQLKELDAKAREEENNNSSYTGGPGSYTHQQRQNITLVNAYRSGQLVPLPEVEELVRVVDHTAYQKGWKGKSLDKQMVENLIIAILNHMKGKVDGA